MESTLLKIVRDIVAMKKEGFDTNGIFVLVSPPIWDVLLNDPSYVSYINVDIERGVKRTIYGCRCIVTDSVEYFDVTTNGEVV